MDMLAEAAGADAVEFRLRHLGGHPRHAAVLRAAAQAGDWGGKLAPGRFQGIAVHESFNSFVAQVAEISLSKSGAIKVEKVACAIDCGIAVNPDVVRAQMESGIGYGLGAAMRNKIALKEGGIVAQNNFPDYEPLRMRDMPEVNTVIVKSGEAPTGVGEPGVPPIAPAVAGAIYAATGKRINDLPFADYGVKFA
jgi:isoquinoline 1-oxidoreductase beta subunit